MDHIITEPAALVITVHKEWTTNIKGTTTMGADKATEKSTGQKRGPKSTSSSSSSSSVVVSSSGDSPPSASVSRPAKSKRRKQPAIGGPRQFEFVHGTDPFRNRDPEVRKIIRVHAMRDAAQRKKKQQQQQQDRESDSQEEIVEPVLARSEEEAPYRTLSPVLADTVWSPAFSHNTLDPSLSLLSIELDPSMTKLVHELEMVSGRMYPRESVFMFNPLNMASWFPPALADKALFHAIIYAVSAYSSLFEGAVGTGKACTESYQFKACTEFYRCIVLVNKRLVGPYVNITDGTIAAVSFLALVDVVSGNEAGWRMHMKGVKKMSEMRGGFSELPKSIQMKLIRTDVAGAVDFLANTHFPFSRPRKPSIYTALSLPKIDVGDDCLSSWLISYKLDEKLITVFAKLTRFSRAVDFALTRTSAPMEPISFVADTFEIQSKLLSIPEPKFYESDEVCLQEALRMGGLIFMKETLQEYPLGPIGSSNLVRRMKGSLSFISDVNKYAPLLLWLLFMGGISSKKCVDRVWFTTHLSGVLPKHSTWEDIRRVLKKVLWIEKLLGDSCRGFWEEVEVTRLKTSSAGKNE